MGSAEHARTNGGYRSRVVRRDATGGRRGVEEVLKKAGQIRELW